MVIGRRLANVWKQPELYSFDCRQGASTIELRAFYDSNPDPSLKSQLYTSYTKDPSDWVPGDLGYLENLKFVKGRDPSGRAGLNAIYVGRYFWFVNTGVKPDYKVLLDGHGPSPDTWETYIRVKWGGKPNLEDYRMAPMTGLDEAIIEAEQKKAAK